jgi:small-conductance mechanosensitive channel
LMVIVSGMSAFLIRSPLIVRGDAAATATNILASESLFRLAFIADLVAGLCYLGVTVLFYGLLKPVSRSVSLLAAFFGLAGVVIGSAVSINSLGALAC